MGAVRFVLCFLIATASVKSSSRSVASVAVFFKARRHAHLQLRLLCGQEERDTCLYECPLAGLVWSVLHKAVQEKFLVQRL